jgi:multidrug efflux pump subunit AcrA (membrane-fusion protein)
MSLLRQFQRFLSAKKEIWAATHESEYSRRYKRRIAAPLLFTTIVIVIFIPGWILLPLLQRGLSVPLGQQMSHRVSTPTVSASGVLQGEVYNLNFVDPSAQLSDINVTQGQFVRQGQVLARLDPASLQRLVDAAQAAVAAAQHRLSATLAYQQRAINFTQALTTEAKVALQAAQATLQATNQQAKADIAAAQTTLKSDQRVLAATEEQAEAQIEAAQAQLKQSIASCQATPANGTSTPTSQNNNHKQTKQTNTVKSCINTAQTQYQQVVAEAQNDVTAAQAQVTKDQATLTQTIASTRVSVTTAQGVVAVALAHIPVAANDPELGSAAKDVAEAQEDVVTATQQLCTAQFNLTTQTVLIAPHDGIVTAINGTVGGPPGPRRNVAPQALGSADDDVFIQLVDLSHINQLLLNVNETNIAKVKTGQNVQFTLKAHSNRHFSGTVSAISPNGVVVNDVMTFPVVVSIATQSLRGITLYLNMTATATIMVGS